MVVVGAENKRVVVFVVNNKVVIGEVEFENDIVLGIKNPVVIGLTPQGIAISEYPLYGLSKSPDVTVNFNIHAIEAVRDAEPHEIELYEKALKQISAGKLGLEIADSTTKIDKKFGRKN